MSEDFPGGWQVLHFAKEIVVKKRFLLASQKDINDIINFISFKGKKGLRPSIFLLKLKRCNELESPPCPFEILKHEKPTSPFFYPVFVDIFQKTPSCLEVEGGAKQCPGCLRFAFWSLVLVSSPLTQAS